MGPRYTAFSDASYHKFHDNIPLKVLSHSHSPLIRWAPTKGGIGPAFILKRQLVFWMLSEIEEPLFFPVVLFFSSKRLSSPSSLSVWGDSNQQGTMGGATVSTGGGGYDSGMRSITSHTSCSGTGGTCSTIDVDASGGFSCCFFPWEWGSTMENLCWEGGEPLPRIDDGVGIGTYNNESSDDKLDGKGCTFHSTTSSVLSIDCEGCPLDSLSS